MNPLYMAIVNAVVARRRKCPACDKEQVVDRLNKNGGFRCKKSSYYLSKKDLSVRSQSRN